MCGRCGILVVHGGVWEVWDSSSTWEVYGRCGILVVHEMCFGGKGF